VNWLKRLLHLEEPEPVEKPEPEPPVLELCPICGRRPKPKYVVRDITLDRHYYLEKAVWQLSEWCDHAAIISSFASLFEDEGVQKWNTGCRRLKAVVDEPVPECPACGEKPVVQTDSESDIPQLVCSCNELLSNVEITNVYKRKHEWIRRCVALKRKQDNVREMEQLIGETQ
jgi:hypothetical protein